MAAASPRDLADRHRNNDRRYQSGSLPSASLARRPGTAVVFKIRVGGAQNVYESSAARCASPLPKGEASPPPSLGKSAPASPPAANPTPPLKQQLSPLTDVMVEARLTCDLSASAALPPAEVEFTPIGGGSAAKLTGPAGDQGLLFISPVRFREHAETVTVINRFGLGPGSDLRGRPVETLLGFAKLTVPIVTVVYGGACARMRLLEITIRVNAEDAWYGQWPYDVPFKQGPVFTVPLDGLHQRLSQFKRPSDGG